MPAPAPSCAFQPFPNHHTLKHRLSALRVVSTRFVDTDDTCYISRVSVTHAYTYKQRGEDARR